MGTAIGVTKGDARSLDYGSYRQNLPEIPCPAFIGTEDCRSTAISRGLMVLR